MFKFFINGTNISNIPLSEFLCLMIFCIHLSIEIDLFMDVVTQAIKVST